MTWSKCLKVKVHISRSPIPFSCNSSWRVRQCSLFHFRRSHGSRARSKATTSVYIYIYFLYVCFVFPQDGSVLMHFPIFTLAATTAETSSSKSSEGCKVAALPFHFTCGFNFFNWKTRDSKNLPSAALCRNSLR